MRYFFGFPLVAFHILVYLTCETSVPLFYDEHFSFVAWLSSIEEGRESKGIIVVLTERGY